MFSKIIKSSLFKTSSIYTLANILNSAIPFFLLPILTVYLTPTDYGIVSMFAVLLGLLLPFMGLNVNGAVTRKFFDKDKNFSNYISTALYILIISSLLVSIIILSFSDIVSELSSFPKEYLILVLMAALGSSVIQVTLGLWQVREKAIPYGIFQIMQTILNVTISLILVVALEYGWLGRVFGQVIAIVLFAIIGIIIIIKREKVTFNFNKNYARDNMRYGVPLIPHMLGIFLITMTDRVFITNMVGISDTGIYTVGFQIGMIIKILQDSFNKAWTPYLYKKLNTKNDKIKITLVKITYIYFVVILLLALILTMIAPIIVKLFIGEAFKDSVNYIMWIAFGFAFNGMYKMVGGVIFYEKKTQLLSIVTFSTAFLNVLFNYIFIKINGAVGAAQATCLAFFVSFVFTWILATKVHFMPWNLIKYRKNY